MTINDLREGGLIILECLSGSKAYGLDTEYSDTDIKGVFLLPKSRFYGLEYIPQVNDGSNNVVFYELGRFMGLLSQNNPNILELLSTPESAVIYRHPFLKDVTPEIFLSKLCVNTFGKFALAQVRKAKGLNKKILNPVAKERKSVLSFCFVNHEKGAMPLIRFLAKNGWDQRNCGLLNIRNMKDIYELYHDNSGKFNGIIRADDSNEVCLSSIPRGYKQEAILYFNRDGYSTYCREYKEYWDWVERRNETRYANTLGHGKNYDAKNMMHVFRLLEMAIEIGKQGRVNVRRPDRDFLLEIKAGRYEYEELLNMADKKRKEMEEAFENSALPVNPDIDLINHMTYSLRDKFYKEFESRNQEILMAE